MLPDAVITSASMEDGSHTIAHTRASTLMVPRGTRLPLELSDTIAADTLRATCTSWAGDAVRALVVVLVVVITVSVVTGGGGTGFGTRTHLGTRPTRRCRRSQRRR
jgi:hypothetical protein